MTVTAAPAPAASVDRAGRRWPVHYTVVALCFAAVLISYLDRTNISVASIAMQEQFGWTETVKGYVLSSFFVGYLLLQVVSGTLANRYGGRLVLGVAVIWWSLFTMLTPTAAQISLAALIGARIALGVGEAAVFPATMNMLARWVPAPGRSRAVAICTSALSLGTLFALPTTGWMVREYGWPVPFYAFGVLGLVWAFPWFLGVSGGRGVAADAEGTTRRIPWARILRTPAVWAIVVNHFSANWALYVLLAWLPSYFKSTFGVTLASAGLLSAAPWALSFVMANVAGTVADRLLSAGHSATFVRKLMQVSGLLGASTLLLLLPNAGSVTGGLLLMSGAAGMWALCMAGFAPNAFDIAPRYADVIWGISNTAGTIPGIVGVAVTGWLVDRTGGFTAPFALTAGLGVFAAVVYLVLGSGRKQID